MLRDIAADIGRIARTQRRLGSLGSDIRAAAGQLADADPPGSPLAAPFAEGLREFFARALATVGEITAWAEQAQENVRATTDDLLGLETDISETLTAILTQLDSASLGTPHGGPRR